VNKNYVQESPVYLNDETHGAEDVSIYASGPMSYLFDGTIEQSHIAHVIQLLFIVKFFVFINFCCCCWLTKVLAYSAW
jgi:alkaline phosphatase